ncbi:hypothetical protein SADUNF_Sadunf01G0140400 [Salix dunnii]|uniref:Uncharacterized protein n=1 Tax=Salix dunnii TaxID=1413687 RepID=A0A835NBU0_9ROSI|nr:hypothetical protein SADUNF_Sadunf01G0140400 [Salix dunnii]
MEDDTVEKSSIVTGLIENRAKEVGMAAFDLRSASLHLSQYIETSSSYQNTKTLLQFYDPVVVIVPPNKFAPDGMLGVSDLVDGFYASVKKVVMARGCFDDTKGAELIKNLAATEPSALGLDTYYKQYYLCLAAAAATIKCGNYVFIHATVYCLFKMPVHHFGVIDVLSGILRHSVVGYRPNMTSFQQWTDAEPFLLLFIEGINTSCSVTEAKCPCWTGVSVIILPLKESFNCIIHRIEAEKGVVVTNHSLLVTFNGSFDHMSIDATRTRLLRANLLQPLKDIKTINTRLDCLDELMSNEQLFFGLSQALRKFPKETDRVLCHFCFKPKKVTSEVVGADNARRSQVLISSIILLKTALDALPLLSMALKDAKSFLLANLYKTISENEKYVSIRKRVGEVIDEDVLHARAPFVARTQQCFAVKAGIDGLLDIARRTFCDTSEAIHNLANTYREDFKLPNLKLPFNNRQGFYFSVPQKDIQGKLPSKFIQLNVRNKSAAAECYIRTEVCLEALLNSIREDVSALTLLAEVLCLLDMIINSFAYTISTKPVDRYTRPEFTSSGPLAIDAGRHPILESIHDDYLGVGRLLFIASFPFKSILDSVLKIVDAGRIVLFRSGKSTYLQQVCLIVILAQIGCYVPARFSTIRVVDRIFTRMGSIDNLESNSSTFMTEMKETAFIMQNVSPRSLVLMDELGKATSSSDGFAIAWSCCEHLLSLKAYSIFATHIENLSELATIYPNVRIVHFHVDIKSNRLDFKVFQLEDGPRHVPHYGLLLAEVAGLPRSVIETARSITSKITEKHIKKMEVNCTQYHKLQMVYRVAQRLICLKYSNQDEDSIRQALHDLKEQYVNGTL